MNLLNNFQHSLIVAQIDDGREVLLSIWKLLIAVFVILLIIWMISKGVSHGIAASKGLPEHQAERLQRLEIHLAQKPQPPDGFDSFRYVVVGVDRASQMDVREFVIASSEANAKIKCELSGIIVTSVSEASSAD